MLCKIRLWILQKFHTLTQIWDLILFINSWWILFHVKDESRVWEKKRLYLVCETDMSVAILFYQFMEYLQILYDLWSENQKYFVQERNKAQRGKIRIPTFNFSHIHISCAILLECNPSVDRKHLTEGDNARAVSPQPGWRHLSSALKEYSKPLCCIRCLCWPGRTSSALCNTGDPKWPVYNMYN
jgi:hypothetical protein